MSEIETFPESVRYSKLPAYCVELIWASGDRVLALPAVYLSSAYWIKMESDESVICDWGGWVVTLAGHGLQRLPGCLVRGEVCAITELELERAEITVGTVVTKILATEKKPEK